MMESTWDTSVITDALPVDARTVLEQMGIHDINFTDLFSVQFSDLARAVLSVFQGALQAPMRFLSTGLGVLMILSVFESMGSGTGRSKEMRTMLSGLFLITACVVPMHTAVRSAVAAVETAGGFVCTLIPVMAAIVAASGSPLLSVCWNTAVFSMAQTVSAAASGFMAPCCGLVAGTGIFTALCPRYLSANLTGKVRKIATWVFSTLATLFTAFLSLKGILAGSADSLAAKGIKLAISSFVPVVGTQLSEAYASVAATVAEVRSTAAVFSILGVCAVVLPSVALMVLWILSLKLLETVAAMLGQKNAETLFSAFSSAISILNACVLFVTVLYILSIGIILKVRGAT